MASRIGLQIRAAESADATILSDLFRASGPVMPAENLAERLDALHRSPTGAALIAVEWGPPSGVVVVSWFQTLRADLPTAQIDLLLVAPDERRRGIGRLLLKAASQAARMAGCGTLLLSTPVEDESLRAFCDATGFEAAGSVFARALRKKG